MTALPAQQVSLTEDDIPDDLFASLPDLPSLDNFTHRVDDIQAALDEARADAEAIRRELHAKAELLRKLAAALETV